MRNDERFVIQALAEKYGASWRPGEDPPDAYLELEGRQIPVEITTLVELVHDAKGKLLPRMSQDEGAIAMANFLDAKVRDAFFGSRGVMLTIFAPLTNQGALRNELETELRKLAAMDSLPEEPIDFAFGGNVVLIHPHDEWRTGHNRVIAAIVNTRSSPDILANAIDALSDRLEAKDSWGAAVKGGWLALFNRYDLLADADTYRQAFAVLSPSHNFERIVIVSTRGMVDELAP